MVVYDIYFIFNSTLPTPVYPPQSMAKNMKTFSFLIFLTNQILSLLPTPYSPLPLHYSHLQIFCMEAFHLCSVCTELYA